MKGRYFFGRTLARRIDFFSFPRCGAHYFRHCTAGLFDLVALPQAATDKPEAVERGTELDPDMLYALELREEGVPYAPVFFNGAANGQHGAPIKGEHPVVILIRDPRAAVYSLWRVSRERWGVDIPDSRVWARRQFEKYRGFYDAGFELLAAHPRDSLLIRYEELVERAAPLERLVEFVGVRPKLRPSFVHRVTRFEAFTRPGERTFYRAGDNGAWRRDGAWAGVVEGIEIPDLSRYGYGA